MRKRWRMTFGSVLLCTALASGCVLPAAAGETEESEKGGHRTEQTELTVFAAASMTETLTKLAETYEQKHPEITISFNFDSSGTLETQILEGSDCDLFVSAAQKQMNELDKDAAPDTNPDNNDELLEGTRTDLLENKVALAVPDGNPKNIRSFDDLADDLKKGSVLLAMGNSDVPVGQALGGSAYIRWLYHIRIKCQRSYRSGLRGLGRLWYHISDRRLQRKADRSRYGLS